MGTTLLDSGEWLRTALEELSHIAHLLRILYPIISIIHIGTIVPFSCLSNKDELNQKYSYMKRRTKNPLGVNSQELSYQLDILIPFLMKFPLEIIYICLPLHEYLILNIDI